MKQILVFVLVIAVVGLVLSCGCTGTAPQSSQTTSGGTGAQQATTISTTAPAGVAATTVSSLSLIHISEPTRPY